MALDLYQACPCHQERKLKFCCGKEVVAQLGKALELMEGEQRRKAVDVLDQSIQKYGHRDCLVTMRFGAAMESDNHQLAGKLCQQYEAENGPTSVGFAMQAICHLEAEALEPAIDAVQNALETGEVPSTLLEDAILSLAVRLSLENHFIAGRDHAALYQAISGDPRGMAESLIGRMMSLPSLPLVLKHDWPMVDPPDGKPWSEEAAQANHWAQQGLWKKAYESLAPLSARYPGEPALEKNVAVLGSRLARTRESADAWRRYANCAGVEHDHAVEAELMYLLLSQFSDSETYSEIEVTCEVADWAALQEGLSGDSHVSHVPGAEEELGPEGQKPSSVYALLDQPALASPADVKDPRDIPNVIAIIQVFGRRTDSEPHVKITGNRDAALERGLERLWEQHPQLKSDSRQEKTISESPRLFEDFDWKWRTPESATGDQITEWCERYWDHLTTQVLPNYETELLGGKTFAEAAGDAQWKKRVEAILLHLGSIHAELFDRKSGVEKARAALNLPDQSCIDPRTIRLEDMTLHQFARLDFAKMPLDMLAWAFQAASTVNNLPAIQAIYADIRRRIAEDTEAAKQFPLAALNAALARLEPRPSRVRELLTEGDQHIGDGPDEMARWCMKAFAVAMEKRQPDLALQYFQQLSTSPMSQEMQIEFARLCSRLGIQPHRGGTPENMARQMEEPSSTILTGSSGSAGESLGAEIEPANEPSASKLWLPGME